MTIFAFITCKLMLSVWIRSTQVQSSAAAAAVGNLLDSMFSAPPCSFWMRKLGWDVATCVLKSPSVNLEADLEFENHW